MPGYLLATARSVSASPSMSAVAIEVGKVAGGLGARCRLDEVAEAVVAQDRHVVRELVRDCEVGVPIALEVCSSDQDGSSPTTTAPRQQDEIGGADVAVDRHRVGRPVRHRQVG